MKIQRQQLEKIIKEEINSLLNEANTRKTIKKSPAKIAFDAENSKLRKQYLDSGLKKRR